MTPRRGQSARSQQILRARHRVLLFGCQGIFLRRNLRNLCDTPACSSIAVRNSAVAALNSSSRALVPAGSLATASNVAQSFNESSDNAAGGNVI